MGTYAINYKKPTETAAGFFIKLLTVKLYIVKVQLYRFSHFLFLASAP